MYNTILFDLDGTLTDPMIGITNSIIYSLSKMNIETPERDALIPFIGPPLSESYEVYYNLTGEQNDAAITYYREYFSETGLYENKPYQGIEIVLNALVDQGKTLYVATSKPEVFAKTILEHFNLSHYFKGIVGSNLDGTRTHKGEVIAHVVDKYQVDVNTAVMIGDRMHDINGGKMNNMDTVGVYYGYGSEEEIKAAKPTYTVATVDYLLDILMK